jgi:hypothetical protein
MDKQRLQQLAGIVTEGVTKCGCGCDKNKCSCSADCKKCDCNKKVDEMANAFGEDGDDGTSTGGGDVAAPAAEVSYENEEDRAAFQNALEVIAREIVKAVPHPPAGQKIDTEEAIDSVMKGRWTEMLKDELRDIIEPGPSHNPDGMSRTEPHITF